MKRSAAITVLAMAVGVLSACSPDAENSPSPTPTVTSADPTPSPSESPTTASSDPTPSPSETLDADQQAARDVVNEFFRLSDELAKNPDLPLQPLADITTGQTQDLYLRELAEYRDLNAVQIGDVKLTLLTVSPLIESDGERTILVQACTDNSDADVVDQNTGESILPPDRELHVSWSINVVGVNEYWLVGDLTNERLDGCPA